MLQFTIADLARALKDRNPDWIDSASFQSRMTASAKQALADYFKQLETSNDLWARSSTLNGSAVSTGSAVFDITSGGSVFRIALPAGQRAIAGDSIFLFKTGGPLCVVVPRSTIEAILVSGTGSTTEVFFENNNEIVLYSKDGDFTGPASMHYNYWRGPTIDTSTPTPAVQTTGALPANTYNDVAAGIGATLTANASGALVINGYTVLANDTIAVANEVVAANNGLYAVTAPGSGGAPYVLTRFAHTLDIRPEDFTQFVDSVFSLMTES